MSRRTLRLLSLTALILLPALLVWAQPKRPLTHKDYDAWRTIGTPTLSRDGRWLAYGFMPQDGDGDLVVRDLKTGKEQRYGVGALPPPPIQDPAEMNPEAPPPPRGIQIRITSDNAYVVATAYPEKAETEKARKEKKKPEEMPKNGLLIVTLASGQAARVDAVRGMQVPEKGGAWVAYQKEPKPEPKAEAKPAAAPPARGARQYGSDLVLRDLTKTANNERTFANAADYSFARDGKTLVFTVSSRKEEENGAFAVTPGADAAPVALLGGKGRYTRLVWDREQSQLVFSSTKDDAAAKQPKWKIYHWDRKSPAATELVSAATPGWPAKFAVSERGQVAFSRDGKKLFVTAALPPKPGKEGEAEATAAPPPAADKVLLDLWHYRDDYVQPMQRIRANQERNRTYRGVFDLAAKKYVQLADERMAAVNPSDDGALAFGADDRPYRRLTDYDGSYYDSYIVDAATGQRRTLARKLAGGFAGFGGGGPQWSPDGKWAYFFNDKHWQLASLPDGAVKNITGGLPVAFHDEQHDSPAAPPAYGAAGWLKDSKSFLVYDKYDVWQIFTGATAPLNLTGGVGRKEKIAYRVARIEPPDPDEDERGFDPAKPLYLRAVSEETRDSGFYRLSFGAAAAPVRLLWGPKNYQPAVKAKGADVVLFTASRFDEYPDLWQTGMNFKTPKRVTDGAAQMLPFQWGTAEQIRYRNTDGAALKATLIKPGNFDPKKKYPLLVYIYETLSEGLHNFHNPQPGTSINPSYYASNGYLLLLPDIVYTVGNPGQSALKCVLPAIDAAQELGFADEKNIGIQGHSWGGYQISYMVTQTARFKAAEAGAPVGNMTSAYSGIRWGSGMPRQFQYEKTQSRIGPMLYEAPHKYLENSAVFHSGRVQTPLLILHNDQDDAVPWYQGIELFLALRRQGKEAYLLNYNGEYHGLRRRHNQKDFTVRMQEFFDHHLKGAPKPEWMQKGVPYVDREDEKEKYREAAYGK